MHCANPMCHATDKGMEGGTLKLLEKEMPPEKRVIRSECGFPVCSAPSRFFWLCEQCSKWLRIARWTETGLVLERRLAESGREPLSMKLPVRRAEPEGAHVKMGKVASLA